MPPKPLPLPTFYKLSAIGTKKSRPLEVNMFMDKRLLVKEAKRSFIVVLSIIGKDNTAFNVALLKWPDVVDCLLDGNDELFLKDVGFLICYPFKLLVESLQDILGDDRSMDVDVSMRLSSSDPLGARRNLVRLCNSLIFRLRSSDSRFVNFEEIRDDRGLF
jgi:hypothetical protein